jgi:L-fuconolactonase
LTTIDAHQHFWRLARGDYRFPSPGDPVLYRDFLPDDLAPRLADSGVAATILVQATDTVAETAFLLELAARSKFVAGVIGWCDPRVPTTLDELARLPGRETLVGVRPMLQGLGDVSWLIEPDALEQLDRVSGMGLVFDALVDPRQLGVISELCRRLPALKVVIDHMGKPWRAPGAFDLWSAEMQALAQADNCTVKVSGFPFATQGDPAMTAEALVRALRNWFGKDRLLWGSDWPVVEREGGYRVALERMQAHFNGAERDAVFSANAVAVYRLGGEFE